MFDQFLRPPLPFIAFWLIGVPVAIPFASLVGVGWKGLYIFGLRIAVWRVLE